MYQPPQSAQKNTNLIVRIDNSNEAKHQITKRKRLKDGAPVRTGQSGQVGDPSDTDQMSEGGPSLHHHHHGGGGNTKQPIFAVDNVE